MRFFFDRTKFLIVWPLLTLVQTLTMLVLWHYVMTQAQGSPWLLQGAVGGVQIMWLILAAAAYAFFFLTVYAQSAAAFPKLTGGLMYGLMVGLFINLLIGMNGWSVMSDVALRVWSVRSALMFLMLSIISGALCGVLYQVDVE